LFGRLDRSRGPPLTFPGALERLHAIEYAQHRSRAHDAVITVYDAAGKLMEVHRHKGDFKEP